MAARCSTVSCSFSVKSASIGLSGRVAALMHTPLRTFSTFDSENVLIYLSPRQYPCYVPGMSSSPRPRAARSTLAEVAAAAGVSVATAARALGGYGSVREDTADRVAEAARRLRYSHNGVARSMVTGRTHTLGAVVADIENPFFGRAMRAFSDVAAQAGSLVLLSNTDEDGTANAPRSRCCSVGGWTACWWRRRHRWTWRICTGCTAPAPRSCCSTAPCPISRPTASSSTTCSPGAWRPTRSSPQGTGASRW